MSDCTIVLPISNFTAERNRDQGDH